MGPFQSKYSGTRPFQRDLQEGEGARYRDENSPFLNYTDLL